MIIVRSQKAKNETYRIKNVEVVTCPYKKGLYTKGSSLINKNDIYIT